MPRHIKDNLSHLFNTQQSWHLELLSNWNAIMGPLSDKVRLEKIQDSTLILGVYDSSWLQELYLLSRFLIQTINKQLSQPYVQEIKFKAAARRKHNTSVNPTHQSKPKKVYSLSPKEEAALAKVDDEQLRLILQEFLIRCQD